MLGTASGQPAAALALYPNPAHGAFPVRPPVGSGPAQAELLNALGQVVCRQVAGTGVAFTVETAGLAAGVYTLRVQAGPATLVERVVLE